MRWLKRGFYLLLVLLLLLVALAAVIYVRYGGGEPYLDVTTEPLIPVEEVELVFDYPEPLGNIAVAADGRIFFTIHPESRPETNKLMVWQDGKAKPFPHHAAQLKLNTPLGVVLDQQNRLWVIDHGMHGTGDAQLLAYDVNSNKLIVQHTFNSDVAPVGSFLQDLQVDSLGETVYIADVGFINKSPSLVVYDVTEQSARRVLTGDPTVVAQNYLIRNPVKDMQFFGGLLVLKPGVDGIAITRDDQWVYYGAMTHEGLYRVPTKALKNADLDDEQLSAMVERVGENKPLNDGMSTDNRGNVYLTDVEHNAVLRMTPDGQLTTLIKDSRIRWPDALSFGAKGWLYVVDSSIPDQMLQSKSHMAEQGPYGVYRFKPKATAPAGQ